jgi:hypothetical protein
MMRLAIPTLALTAALTVIAATPSSAGFNLMCSGEGVQLDFPLGGGAGFDLMSATVRVGDRTWTTDTEVKDAEQITTYQSARVEDRIYIDLADPAYMRVVARVRLFQIMGYDDSVTAGVLELVDVGAYPITCDFG